VSLDFSTHLLTNVTAMESSADLVVESMSRWIPEVWLGEYQKYDTVNTKSMSRWIPKVWLCEHQKYDSVKTRSTLSNEDIRLKSLWLVHNMLFTRRVWKDIKAANSNLHGQIKSDGAIKTAIKTFFLTKKTLGSRRKTSLKTLHER
jgi:hypothetical protein